MRRCFHCLEPGCVSACPTTALYRQPDGPVSYDVDKCIGCRYCMLACPWDVPTAEWDKLAPKIEKCTHCADRADQPVPVKFNGAPASEYETKRFVDTIMTPACVKACPADALRYGTRDEMLALAHKRMEDRPDRYVDHIYGEKELGGTSVLYLSSVPFETIGFPKFGEKPFPRFTAAALGAVPPAVVALGALFGALYAFFRKRTLAVAGASSGDGGHHVEFERLREKMMTPFNWLLLLLMAFCGVSMVARFAMGLGGSTHLSDTYPWGLWILFDLVWIAVAAGAFAMAGTIYIFQRKDLYGLGRGAVLMGLLSYSFVTVTLIADLGLPWHFYQLGLQSPEHSAMFEVSWCVGLYVTILLFEFLPVALEQWGFPRLLALWRRWSGTYVAFAVTLFVFMLSRNPVYAAGTAVIFGTLAWIFRDREKSFEPILLAIAAVTLSTMHQSSLGSLYLLMPNMLAPQWWSPDSARFVLPVLDRGGDRSRDPDRDVDFEGLASPASDEVPLVRRENHVRGAHRVPRVPARRHGATGAAFGRVLRSARVRLRGGDPPRGGRSARPAVPQVAARPPEDAFRGGSPRGPRHRVQSDERRALRDDVPGPHALGRPARLHAVDRRMGHFRRSHRRDDLPVRPRRAASAGSREGGTQRRALSL